MERSVTAAGLSGQILPRPLLEYMHAIILYGRAGSDRRRQIQRTVLRHRQHEPRCPSQARHHPVPTLHTFSCWMLSRMSAPHWQEGGEQAGRQAAQAPTQNDGNTVTALSPRGSGEVTQKYGAVDSPAGTGPGTAGTAGSAGGGAPDIAVCVLFFLGMRAWSRGNQRLASSPTVDTSTILHGGPGGRVGGWWVGGWMEWEWVGGWWVGQGSEHNIPL